MVRLQKPGRRYFGPMAMPEVVARLSAPFTIIGLAIPILVLVDLALYSLSRACGVVLDVDAWGTYAAWATAILPTIGIAMTVGMWLVEREASDIERAASAMMLVSFVKPPDGLSLLSVEPGGSPAQIVELRSEEGDVVDKVTTADEKVVSPGYVVFPGGHIVLRDIDEVAVRVLDRCFKMSLGEPAQRMLGRACSIGDIGFQARGT